MNTQTEKQTKPLKKNPTTLAGWQKLYSGAIKMTAKSGSLLTNKQIIEFVFGKDGKELYFKITATLHGHQKGALSPI